MGKESSLYERIGGHTEIAKLANRFYDIMERDEIALTVLMMHPKDLTRSRKRLENYLCEWFGGPKLFGELYVNPEWTKLRHQHLDIGTAERDQWIHCMTTAMRELEFDAELQQELTNKFYELAGFVRSRV